VTPKQTMEVQVEDVQTRRAGPLPLSIASSASTVRITSQEPPGSNATKAGKHQ
jgi:hypothetical protein